MSYVAAISAGAGFLTSMSGGGGGGAAPAPSVLESGKVDFGAVNINATPRPAEVSAFGGSSGMVGWIVAGVVALAGLVLIVVNLKGGKR